MGGKAAAASLSTAAIVGLAGDHILNRDNSIVSKAYTEAGSAINQYVLEPLSVVGRSASDGLGPTVSYVVNALQPLAPYTTIIAGGLGLLALGLVFYAGRTSKTCDLPKPQQAAT